MESTLSTLKTQIKKQLNGIHSLEPVQYNEQLALVLDEQNIPIKAKLACLAIDTSMSHLDSISGNHLSKNAILIGDLISAHFYTLTAEINDSAYLEKMSSAIIKVNEYKTALHYKTLHHENVKKAIIYIDTVFPMITIKHFNPAADICNIENRLIEHSSKHYPAYLKSYSENELRAIFDELNSNTK